MRRCPLATLVTDVRPVRMNHGCLDGAAAFETALRGARRRDARRLHQLRQMLRGLSDHRARPASPTPIRRRRSRACSTSCASATGRRPRANGRAPACSRASASRSATTASTRASCSTWRASPWRAPRTSRASGASSASTASAWSRATSTQLSRMQLTDAQLARLGQNPSAEPARQRRAAGRRVLHRLQRAQDAAHRAARARHHGRARRELSRHGRPEPLLRRRADAHRRRRHLGPLRARTRMDKLAAQQDRTGAGLVPELLRSVHRGHAADGRAHARRAAVRDDAVRAVPAHRSSTACGRCCASRCRCGSRSIATPARPA